MSQTASPISPPGTLDRRRVLAAGVVAVAGLAPSAARAGTIDRILVEKGWRRMTLLAGDAPVHVLNVALGRGQGPKRRRGDGRTPEGTYELGWRNPHSAFYRSIGITYPNDEDRRRAAAEGAHPGGSIMIHGLDPGIAARWREQHWMFNWTNGCIAVTNAEMDLIWESVTVGTPIEIRA